MVVGAGIAGIACARRLAGAGLPVVVRDRGRRPGGRMGGRTLHGRTVDLGAQYFTVREPGFARVVEHWHQHGRARPWTDTFHTGDGRTLGAAKPGPQRWGAPGGLRSLVEDLATGIDVRQQQPVQSVRTGVAGPEIDGVRVRAVVLAMPDPQAARLLTDDAAERPSAPGIAAPLDHEWAPTIALAAGWPSRRWDVDGVFVNADAGALSWIADDGRRRGDGAAVLVAHSTSELAHAHLTTPEDAGPAMLTDLHRQLGIRDEPHWTYVQRWRYAKPVSTREEPYRLLDESGTVGICGDGWSPTAKVEGAWSSGDALGVALVERLS